MGKIHNNTDKYHDIHVLLTGDCRCFAICIYIIKYVIYQTNMRIWVKSINIYLTDNNAPLEKKKKHLLY